MPSTYILYSKTLGRYYIGSTREDSEDRLYKHNHKHKGYTASATDWKLVYEEFFPDYKDALAREFRIKGWKSRKKIETLLAKAGFS